MAASWRLLPRCSRFTKGMAASKRKVSRSMGSIIKPSPPAAKKLCGRRDWNHLKYCDSKRHWVNRQILWGYDSLAMRLCVRNQRKLGNSCQSWRNQLTDLLLLLAQLANFSLVINCTIASIVGGVNHMVAIDRDWEFWRLTSRLRNHYQYWPPPPLSHRNWASSREALNLENWLHNRC